MFIIKNLQREYTWMLLKDPHSWIVIGVWERDEIDWNGGLPNNKKHFVRYAGLWTLLALCCNCTTGSIQKQYC